MLLFLLTQRKERRNEGFMSGTSRFRSSEWPRGAGLWQVWGSLKGGHKREAKQCVISVMRSSGRHRELREEGVFGDTLPIWKQKCPYLDKGRNWGAHSLCLALLLLAKNVNVMDRTCCTLLNDGEEKTIDLKVSQKWF